MKKLLALALLIAGCTSTGQVAPDLGQRAVEDAACALAIASATSGASAAVLEAAQACREAAGNVAESAQGAAARIKERKAK